MLGDCLDVLLLGRIDILWLYLWCFCLLGSSRVSLVSSSRYRWWCLVLSAIRNRRRISCNVHVNNKFQLIQARPPHQVVLLISIYLIFRYTRQFCPISILITRITL